MLTTLKIENIAVIKKAVIDFKNGFNVLTGETGAGKSIVIDSINAVLGERTSRELIRNGSDFAAVSALFTDVRESVTALLEDLGVDTEADGTLLIQRKMSADGKNACRINGCPVTVSILKKVGKLLVNIHGQLDNQFLLSPEYHCTYIDRLAENETLKAAFADAYRAYRKKDKELRELHMDEREKAHKIDLLTYQVNELEEADIRVGEMQELSEQRDFFRNAEKISELLNRAYALLNGEEQFEGAVQSSLSAAAALESASSYSSQFEPIFTGINDAAYALSSYTEELRDLLFTLEYDPSQADAVEERLDILYKLSQKYGETEEEMLAYLESARAQLEQITMSEEMNVRLQAERDAFFEDAQKKARALSENRRAAARVFADEVTKELAFLNMPSVTFAVACEQTEMHENGIDKIEFLISANAGELPKPLAKIASGGELSRVMLAIKSVLSDKDEIDTLIFDEIDTGVSGRAAQRIALKMKQVAEYKQVICITHLAQIAAVAHEHLLIEKSERDGQTYTELHALDFEGRKRELARIMGGEAVTDLMLQGAEELLRAANA